MVGMPFSTRWMRAASWGSGLSGCGLGKAEADAIRETILARIRTMLLDDLEFIEFSVKTQEG
jgi:hypothetical protein